MSARLESSGGSVDRRGRKALGYLSAAASYGLGEERKIQSIESGRKGIEPLQNGTEEEPIGPQVITIFISPDKGVPMQEVDEVLAVAGQGLYGDRYKEGRGAYSNARRQTVRQVSLISEEAIEGTEFEPSETRRNIIVRGIDLNSLVGQEFQIGQIKMRGIEACNPCERPSDLSRKKGFGNAFEGKGGLLAEITSSGVLRPGDKIIKV